MEEKLDQQIKKLLELQEELKQKPLTLEELKEIALSSGIQEFEWNEMLQTAEKDTNLAHQHMQFRNYQDAFDRASEAATINPYLTKAMLIASEAAIKIYQSEDKEEYLDKAEYFAREILKLTPSESQAVKILASIENFERKEKNEKKQKLYLLGGLAVAVLIIVIAVIYFKSKPPKENSRVKNELIVSHEDAVSQWAQVENVISRRDNLIPQLMSLVDNNDPNIISLKNGIDNLQKSLENADENQRIEIQAQLQKKISELTALIKKKNDSKQMELLMVQIEGTYNRISVETKRYNEKVRNYNILVKQYSDQFSDFKEMSYYNQK